MEMRYEISGYHETLAKLEQLEPALEAKVYADGLAAVARKVKGVAKRLAPVGKGPALRKTGDPRRRLKDSISVKRIGWRWGPKRVYVKRSAAIVVAGQPHAHLVERGTVERVTTSGARRGAVKAQPFLTPALRDNAGLMAAFRRGVSLSLPRTIKRIDQGKGRFLSRGL